jgi:hypothetical protein
MSFGDSITGLFLSASPMDYFDQNAETASKIQEKIKSGDIGPGAGFLALTGLGLVAATAQLASINSYANPYNALLNLFQGKLKDLGPITVDNPTAGKPIVVGVEMDRGSHRFSAQDNKLLLHIDSDGDGKADRDETIDAKFVRKGEHGKTYLEAKYDVNGDGKDDTIVVDRKGGKWQAPEIIYG